MKTTPLSRAGETNFEDTAKLPAPAARVKLNPFRCQGQVWLLSAMLIVLNWLPCPMLRMTWTIEARRAALRRRTEGEA